MAGSTGHPPRPRRRVALAGTAGFALGLAWAWLAAISPPLAIGCDPAIPRPICEDTADAGLRRGMPNLRPLIVRADVVPGPEPTMPRWRKRLFVATSHIAADAASYFSLPLDRTAIVGTRIEL